MASNIRVLQFRKSDLPEPDPQFSDEQYNRSRALDQLQAELLQRENTIVKRENDLLARQAAHADRMRDESAELASLKGNARRAVEDAEAMRDAYEVKLAELPPPPPPPKKRKSIEEQFRSAVRLATGFAVKSTLSFAFFPAIPLYALGKGAFSMRKHGFAQANRIAFSALIELTTLSMIIPAMNGISKAYSLSSDTADGVFNNATVYALAMNKTVHDGMVGKGFDFATDNMKLPGFVTRYTHGMNEFSEDLSGTLAALLSAPAAIQATANQQHYKQTVRFPLSKPSLTTGSPVLVPGRTGTGFQKYYLEQPRPDSR